MLDFADGTANPDGAGLPATTLVGEEDAAHAGGSYVVVQRYLHDMAAWRGQNVATQEEIVGRTKFDGVELPWMPLTGPRLLPSEADWLPERWREMALEMMATPFGPGTAVVIGRSGGPAFRRSELLRLVHLAGIAASVAHLPPA